MESFQDTRDQSLRVLDAVEKVIVGKRDVLQLILIGILARGHILLEDFPGLAKTLMASSFAQVIGMDFNRIQFTPDLLPATSLELRSIISATAASSSVPGPCSPIFFLATRSTGRLPRPRPRCSRPCGRAK